MLCATGTGAGHLYPVSDWREINWDIGGIEYVRDGNVKNYRAALPLRSVQKARTAYGCGRAGKGLTFISAVTSVFSSFGSSINKSRIARQIGYSSVQENDSFCSIPVTPENKSIVACPVICDRAVTTLGLRPLLALFLLTCTSAISFDSLILIMFPLIIMSPAYELPSASQRFVKDLDEISFAVATWKTWMEHEPAGARSPSTNRSYSARQNHWKDLVEDWCLLTESAWHDYISLNNRWQKMPSPNSYYRKYFPKVFQPIFRYKNLSTEYEVKSWYYLLIKLIMS